MITQKIIARTDSLKLDKIISRYGEDSMRQVVFIILRPDPDSEELIPITIPEDAVGSFRILKPSGNFVIVPMSKSVLSSGETAFDVVLPASANTSKGSGYYDIRITSDTDKYYFTAQGDFIIDDNIISGEVLEDVSEVNGLIFPDDFLTVEDHVAYIDDDTISTDSTWSSDKINDEIEAHAGGDVSKTVSGNPITFDDGADAPLVKCVTEIQGSQDLHGYDKPWVGGSRKNKLPKGVSGTSGTIEYTVNDDGSVLVTGTENPSTAFWGAQFSLPAGSYILSGCPAGGGNSSYLIDIRNAVGGGGIPGIAGDTGRGSSFTLSEPLTAYVNIRIASGYAIPTGGITFYPMIRLSTVSDSTFAPYSNICPITAYTEGEIEVSDGDGNTTTHTTTYPSAIYRGSEDVVNGSVETEKIKIQSDGTDFLIASNGILYNDSNILTGVSSVVADLMQTITDKYDFFAIIGGTVDLVGQEGKFGLQIIGNVIRIAICDSRFTTAEDFRTYLANNPLEIAYKLATPTTSSVTPTNAPVKSLNGYNHIESSTGDMEVEYITERFQPLIDSIAQL